LALGLGPRAEVVPGEQAQLRLAVRNDATTWVRAKIELIGLPPEWATAPPLVGPLRPGETRLATAQLSVPTGYTACTLSVGIRATALDPATGNALPLPVSADLDLAVVETATVQVFVPDQVFGGWQGRFVVTLANRGQQPQLVLLSGPSAAGVRVRFQAAQARLAPGGELRVRARVRRRRPVLGAPQRLPFTVQAAARGAPVTAASTFVQSPWLAEWVTRALVLAVTVAAFATLGTLLVLRLSSAYTPKTQAPSTTLARVPPRAKATAATVPSGLGRHVVKHN